MKMLHIGLLGDSLQAGVEFFDPCLCDAVTVIQNSCVAGAMGGLLAGRLVGSFTAADYAAIANAARAIADEFIVRNTASGAAIADADNANVGPLVQSVSSAAITGGGYTSVTAADYITIANQIYAASKQAITKLI
jgi:hypothetical protein